MKLLFHNYRYYPYEQQLALREVSALLGDNAATRFEDGLELAGEPDSDRARRLVYFSQVHDGRVAFETVQARLERAVTAGKRRQATRYSVHGLHEYKGKFNPQIAKAILNIFGVRPDDNVLDPFCGSGTTLVECAQIGARATGIDLNPLAVFIANAKLKALATPSNRLQASSTKLSQSLKRLRTWSVKDADAPRIEYLSKWFDPDILGIIETVRRQIISHAGDDAPFFLCIASNLLRDYSQQDPNDLRVRRRTSPLPATPFVVAFLDACASALNRLAEAQAVLGTEVPQGGARHASAAGGAKVREIHRFDAALTSPPYAMALPYIDTQRLSLVWLDLLAPEKILPLEADLIGSREMRGAARKMLRERLKENADGLPEGEFAICQKLQSKIGASDGFRRKAVPQLLYRYFSEMQAVFVSLRGQLKIGAPFALIVGHNHTILGGKRFDIDTPRHLAALALHAGWQLDEILELQTYQRYGYHMDNAVAAESLILLRNR